MSELLCVLALYVALLLGVPIIASLALAVAVWCFAELSRDALHSLSPRLLIWQRGNFALAVAWW